MGYVIRGYRTAGGRAGDGFCALTMRYRTVYKTDSACELRNECPYGCW